MAKIWEHRTAFALLLGGVVSAVFCLLHVSGALRAVENVAYDQRFRWLARPELASKDVVIIALDNSSFESSAMLDNFGRWPWRRNLYARLLWYLRQAPARAIGIDVLFAGASQNEDDDQQFAAQLAEKPDTVIAFSLSHSLGSTDPERPELRPNAWPVDNAACGVTIEYTGLDLPLARLSQKARALGCVSVERDVDGHLRQAPLLFRYKGAYYPSFSLALTAPLLQPGPPRASFECDRRVRVAGREIPLDAGGNALVYWYGPRPGTEYAFPHYPVWQIHDSAFDLSKGEKPEIGPAVFKDKIVLIGPSATGIGDFHASPFSAAMPGPEYHATLISNQLQGHFVRPAGLHWALLAICLMGLGTSLVVWTFADWRVYTLVTIAFAAGYVAMNFWLFDARHISMVAVAPLAAAATSFAGGNLTRYVTEGREKKRYRATLMKYVSPQLVEAIMHNPRLAELHNDKLDLTVLFSDVRGFTSLSEKIPVDQLVATLNEFLNVMVEVIFQNGGTLDKFVGDCVMAIWGAPVRQENHAELAARTALKMMAALGHLNEQWRRQGRPELAIGVGINSGEMIFGNIGAERRMDFTVIGDNVNLASRLESSTKELKASIVISDATYQRIAGQAEVRDLGTIKVKGKDTSIRVYELLGMSRKGAESDASIEVSR